MPSQQRTLPLAHAAAVPLAALTALQLVRRLAPRPDTLARGGIYVFVRPSPADLAELAALIDAGKLFVDIAATYPMADAAAAYRQSKDGHVRGQFILTP